MKSFNKEFGLATALLLTSCATAKQPVITPTETARLMSEPPRATLTASVKLPTPTILPTQTRPLPSPTELPKSPTLTPTKVENRTLFGQVMSGFSDQVPGIRTTMDNQDPERAVRINKTLNQNRVNFLVFGRGETYEPPVVVTPGNRIGSFSVYSVNMAPQNGLIYIDVVSISHDYDSIPVAIATYGSQRAINPNTRINRTIDVGGLKLMRAEIERGTGLSIDFTVVVEDTEIAKAIDNLFRGVDITPEANVKLFPYFMNGQLQSPLSFEKGKKLHLTGSQAVGAIKAVPVEENGIYDRSVEHHARENWISDGLLMAFLQNLILDREFPGRLMAYANDKIAGRGDMVLDFDPRAIKMAVDTLYDKGPGFVIHPWDIGLPKIRSRMYIADERSSSTTGNIPGCWGVRYGNDMFVPIGADPLTQTPLDYWRELRACVGQNLPK